MGISYILDQNNARSTWFWLLKYPVLRKDGVLISAEARSGNETLIAKISSAPLTFGGEDTVAYQIAYDPDEEILFVYMGDSHQLFAFQE